MDFGFPLDKFLPHNKQCPSVGVWTSCSEGCVADDGEAVAGDRCLNLLRVATTNTTSGCHVGPC